MHILRFGESDALAYIKVRKNSDLKIQKINCINTNIISTVIIPEVSTLAMVYSVTSKRAVMHSIKIKED
ncbi:MAG: hypothetical protein ACM3XP_01405 [Nitrososphaerales archaeon]